MPAITLVIGTRNYSSWSLRPWILLKHLGLPFEERLIHLETPEFASEVPKLSPSRRVPALIHGDVRAWDSLSICEYANELSGGRGWPAGTAERAHARSIAAEMHSGFQALRGSCPMNCRARGRSVRLTPEIERDLRRIDDIWSECRRASADRGPWLFGEYSAADAMFAPVVLRCRTYSLPIEHMSRQYCETVLGDPLLGEWLAAAEVEGVVVPSDEAG
ncbi:MAG: glutathione S-transferase family protein [Steroidobacteraceae bacterium]|nr:glutathione S-transferase family protein [Steroidobacteraceae bacterium]